MFTKTELKYVNIMHVLGFLGGERMLIFSFTLNKGRFKISLVNTFFFATAEYQSLLIQFDLSLYP